MKADTDIEVRSIDKGADLAVHECFFTPEVAAKWISLDIDAGKWGGNTPPPLPEQ